MPLFGAPSPGRYRYWAFISYTWSDKRQARSLHRRLERFIVPAHIRRSLPAPDRRGLRLRPVFVDDEELPPSGVLEERLRDAIDSAAAMVLLASPGSAESRYVDLEVTHFLTTRGFTRLAIVAIGESRHRHPPLPESLRCLPGERLWIDCRDDRRPSRRALMRIVAVILGVDFDALWGRYRRRRRKILAAWSAFAVLIAAVVGTALWQQRLAEQRSPERQTAIFREWYERDIRAQSNEPNFKLSRTDDLNDDGLIDYFVDNQTEGFCGSGGCGMEVYITRKPGDYVLVLPLLGDSSPRVRTTGDGPKQIVITELTVSREPLYSVYSLHGEKYEKTSYEYCDGRFFEYCTPTVIGLIPQDDPPGLAPGTKIRERPHPTALPAADLKGVDVTVIGALPGRHWYLVRGEPNAFRGSAGFVPASAIRH